MFTRRQFVRTAIFTGAAAALGRCIDQKTLTPDDVLRRAVNEKKVPAIVGMAATGGKTVYSGAFGVRNAASHSPVTVDSIFALASMTKPVTSVAAMQLVERGKLRLDEPAATYAPALRDLKVLEGFDEKTGKPKLRPARGAVTLRQLLTHTSGFAYETWDANMLRYDSLTGTNDSSADSVIPLIFDPGTRWQYGASVDWVGRIVEIVSGKNLEEYFRAEIFEPLGMSDTSYNLPADKLSRWVTASQRDSSGALQESSRTPRPRKKFPGGGGLYSTAPDYVRFCQVMVNHGRAGKKQILRPETVEMMLSNQIGELTAGRLKTVQPEFAGDVDFDPGADDKFGLGFLINTRAHPGGRSAGSGSWAGLFNTYFWIDPHRELCAVLMMQYLPFVDKQALDVLAEFERAVYTRLS